MDFRVGAHGGSDGCIDFKDQANAKVAKCIAEFKLNDLYGEVCDKVSTADFFVIAAEAVMGRTASDFSPSDRFNEDTLLGQFMLAFKYGRQSVKECPAM
jgi:hypothetical protein